MDRSPQDILGRDMYRYKKQLKEGDQRINAYYREEIEPPNDYPELDTPPHLILMKRGLELIDFAATKLTDARLAYPSPEYEVEILLYGVGMESLLKGIHLKIDTDEFINFMSDFDRTPSLSDSKSKVISDLSDKLPPDQCDCAKLILDLICEHRNNDAHLAFHRNRQYYLKRLILEIALKLLLHYSETEVPESNSIETEITELRQRSKHAVSSKIEFDPEGHFV